MQTSVSPKRPLRRLRTKVPETIGAEQLVLAYEDEP